MCSALKPSLKGAIPICNWLQHSHGHCASPTVVLQEFLTVEGLQKGNNLFFLGGCAAPICLWPFSATTGSHKSRTTVLAAMLLRPFAGQVMRRGRADGTAAPLGGAEDLMGAGTALASDTSALGNAEAWPWLAALVAMPASENSKRARFHPQSNKINIPQSTSWTLVS